jgi:hypothetical protein
MVNSEKEITKMRILVPMLLLTCIGVVYAGIETWTGEEGSGPSNTISLVYATVTAISDHAGTSKGGTHELTLDIKATLAGPYDAAANPTLKCDLYYGVPNAYKKRPQLKINDKVLVFLTRGYWTKAAMEKGTRESPPPDRILNMLVNFMPHQAPLVVVKDFEDPIVSQTISKLRRICRPADMMKGQGNKEKEKVTAHKSGTIYNSETKGTADWKKCVDGMQWEWHTDMSNPLGCITQCGSKYDIRLLSKANDRESLTIAILLSDKVVYSWRGHSHSVFQIIDDKLYYVQFHTSGSGGSIIAIDLKTGNTLWTSRLKAIGPIEHSAYHNLMNLTANNDIVCIYGNESMGRYIEIKNTNTGDTIGHKIISKGE